MPDIHPFLWFDDQAEEAAEFYVSVFPNSRIADVIRYGDGAPGPGVAMTVRFVLDGREFVALNGGPAHYGFNLAVSFVIDCATPAEVDHYWDALTDGGEEIACGWLQDRFGLSWQVVPTGLAAVLGDSDPERADRAMKAMLGMKKLDVAAMYATAAAGGAKGRVAVARCIDASAEDIFKVLTDPSLHPSIDGSGMLRSAEPQTLKGIGDEFLVNMHNDDMGNYVMSNLVVEYEPDRRITWEPALAEAAQEEHQARIGLRAGVRWGYELTATGPRQTLVAEVFDCTNAPEWLRSAVQEGEEWRPAMISSLEKLATGDFTSQP